MSKSAEEQRPSVQKLLMTPLMLGMTALLLLIGAGLYAQYDSYYDRQLSASRSAALMRYQASVQDHHTIMGSLLEVVAADSRLAPLFESRDASAMESLYYGTFERLRAEYRIASLVFIDPQNCVIADITHPENRNAIVNRFIFSEAKQSGVAVIGLDVGESGGLTLRMVRPVFRYNVLLGYIEAAIDFTDVLRAMSDVRNTSLVFILQKSAVTKEVLEDRASGRTPGLWVDAGGDTFIYTPAKVLGKEVLLALLKKRGDAGGANGHFTLFFGYDYYVAGVSPLRDSLGAPLGDLLIVENATALWHEYILTALLLLGFGAVIILACRRLVAGQLAKTDAQLAGMMAKISENDVIFENLFKESETGFVLQNWATGEILRANRAALAIFDVSEPAKIRLSMLHPLPPGDPLRANWQSADANSPLMSVMTKKGVAYCEMSHFFLGGDSELQGIAIRDVTRVVGLQNKNRDQINYLQDVIDQLPGVVFIKDSQCRLLMYNAAFEQFFGDGRSMIGKIRFAEWLGDDLDVVLARDRDTLASGKPATFEHTFTLRNGEERTLLASQKLIASASGGSGGKDLLCVATDITDRSRLEKQLNSLRLKAEEASQAKSQFLARMSHEIRTPMNVILGMSHLALSSNPDDRQRNYLAKIHGAAGNLLGIINDILDFSKIEAGEMTLETIPFDLDSLLGDIEAGVPALLGGKPVAFRLARPIIPNRLMGDPLRIRQVLFNLVNNAVKFTEKGHVELACRVLEERAREYVLEFSVEDTGIGIPEDAMPRLFSSFQQVDGSTTRKYGGTGLGLVISQQFVRLMGGDLGVSSAPGRGSTFSFVLTLGKTEKTAQENDVSGASSLQHEANSQPLSVGRPTGALPVELPPSAHILVVEDNEINQEIIVELLERHNLRVTAVNNGREAVRAVETERFDLVLMDLQMPVMDGLEATRAIRALPRPQAGAVPVIALTANAMNEDRERCLEAGMDDFLSKPIDVRELDARLGQWLKPKADQEEASGGQRG